LTETLKEYGGSTSTIHIIDKYIKENQEASHNEENNESGGDKKLNQGGESLL